MMIQVKCYHKRFHAWKWLGMNAIVFVLWILILWASHFMSLRCILTGSTVKYDCSVYWLSFNHYAATRFNLHILYPHGLSTFITIPIPMSITITITFVNLYPSFALLWSFTKIRRYLASACHSVLLRSFRTHTFINLLSSRWRSTYLTTMIY